LNNRGSARADSGVSSDGGSDPGSVANKSWSGTSRSWHSWLGDRLGESARAVGDGEGLRRGSSVGLAVTWGNGGGLWAEGSESSDNLGGAGVVTYSTGDLVECVGSGGEAEDREDLNRLHCCLRWGVVVVVGERLMWVRKRK